LNPGLVSLLTVLGFGLPLFGCFWLLRQYSVNVIFGDQWDDVTVIAHSYTHLFDWSSLWAQHNENRIFFPNLIVLVLARVTSFNTQIEEYLSTLMLIVATALLIWAHRRRAPTTPWLYYCPVAILAFSVVQYENMLEGFQMAWCLVYLALAVIIVLIDRAALTWIVFAGAIVAAVIGSFSSLQGLLIWAAGLVLLYHRRRRTPFVVVWIVCAVASIVVYFHNFDTSEGSPSHAYAFQHPLAALKFFVFAVGDVLGYAQQNGKPGNPGVLIFGVVLLALALFTLVLYGGRRDRNGPAPIGVALVCVGLLFDAMITEGRVIFGLPAASQSRYTTFDLLVPIGIFLALLVRPTLGTEPRPSASDADGMVSEAIRAGQRGPGRIDTVAIPVARWVLAAVIVVQIASGLYFGLPRARELHASSEVAVRVLRNIDHTTDATVEFPLDPFYPESFVRQQARIAQKHHLSLFANPPSR
jgi:uncharacterized membrane protein HdeD (DUF308 family)